MARMMKAKDRIRKKKTALTHYTYAPFNEAEWNFLERMRNTMGRPKTQTIRLGVQMQMEQEREKKQERRARARAAAADLFTNETER